jgi:hypothetical protein
MQNGPRALGARKGRLGGTNAGSHVCRSHRSTNPLTNRTKNRLHLSAQHIRRVSAQVAPKGRFRHFVTTGDDQLSAFAATEICRILSHGALEKAQEVAGLRKSIRIIVEP